MVRWVVGSWAVVLCATSSIALERTAVRISDDDVTDWNMQVTCTLAYYNVCTGWTWMWEGWDIGHQAGVVFRAGASAQLESTLHFAHNLAPPGYGWTGLVEVLEADSRGCPVGPALAVQNWFPPCGVPCWYNLDWDIPVPERFVVRVTFDPWTGFLGDQLFSDHPAPGPEGPPACGVCFPTNRIVHTFNYGSGGAYCPGIALTDGWCDVEFLWEARLDLSGTVTAGERMEASSWGRIKTLYR